MPRSLVVILAVALLVRLGWALTRPAPPFASLPDQREYVEIARNLLGGRGYVFHDDRVHADVYAFRAPGYPTFLAALGANVHAIRAAQCLLDTSTVLAIFLLARRWLPHREAAMAAIVVAANPYLVSFTALLLTETLFITLLAWGLTLLAYRRTWAGTLLLALSVLVRPSALFLPILMAAASRERSWRPSAIGLTMTLLVLLPWCIRNQMILGKPVLLTTNGGFTLYDGFHLRATGASDQTFVSGEMRDELARQPNEIARSNILSHHAWQFIRERPARVAWLAVVKVARTWSPFPLSREYGADPKVVIVAAAYTIPLFVLVVVGLWIAPIPRAAKVLLMLPAIYFTAVHAMSIGSLRYRIPADVTMTVIAAGAIGTFTRKPAKSSSSASAP